MLRNLKSSSFRSLADRLKLQAPHKCLALLRFGCPAITLSRSPPASPLPRLLGAFLAHRSRLLLVLTHARPESDAHSSQLEPYRHCERGLPGKSSDAFPRIL